MSTPPDTATDQIRALPERHQRSGRNRQLTRRRAAQAMIIIASICGLAATASQLLPPPNPTDTICRMPGSATLTSSCSQPAPSPQPAPVQPHTSPP